MALGPGDPAMMVARLNTMRLGASRLGYYEPVVSITLNGIPLTGEVKALAAAGLTIDDTEGGTPNTASLTVTGVTPIVGQEIRIGLGGLGRGQLLFAGHIIAVTQIYVGGASNIHYQLSCISYEWLLNDRPVTGRFLSTSATAVVLWIMSGAQGFSTAGVEPGLPVLDEITFTNVDRTTALDRVKDRIGGGAWLVDYGSPKVLHFGLTITPWSSAIHPITTADPHGMTNIARTIDLSQARSRIEVEGGGANATAPVPAGSPTLPIADPSWYDEVHGGTVVSGPQRIDYAGVVEGGAGALVGTTFTPTNGPTVTGRAATGMTAGYQDWVVTFGTAAGKTLPGPRTQFFIGGALAPPAVVPVATKLFGGGKTAGVHQWKFAYLTALGQTLASVASAAVTMEDLAGPTAIGAASEAIGGGGSVLGGASYSYKGTFRLPSGAESLPGPASNTVSKTFTGGNRLTRAGNSTPPPGADLQFYRSNGGAWKRLPGASDGFTSDDATYYYDRHANGALGVDAPTAGTLGYRSASLVIPVSTNPLVTHVRIFCTEAGGSVFKTVADVVNGTLSYIDSTPDGSLGATELSTATAIILAADLTNIPIGPAGTTYRDLWRGTDGGQLKFLATIANNTTTIYTDTTPNGSLGANIHTADTSGLVAETGNVPAGSTSLLITSTAPFQAGGGWALFGATAVRYGGVSGTALTGIPLTGPGSLGTTLRYGSEVIAAHMLIGIPPSGTGSIRYDIPAGEPVNIFITRNDLAAQAVLAALLSTPTAPHDGIVVESIQNNSLGQIECENRGDARLVEVKDPLVMLSYDTPDMTHRSGRSVTYALGAPTNIAGTFKVQRVSFAQFDGGLSRPIRTIEASSRTLTFEAILRLQREAA